MMDELGSLEDAKEFDRKRNYDYGLAPRYWTITFPGEYGQHVVETWSEHQIIMHYYKHWCSRMIENAKEGVLSRENCIADWCAVHWAVETDKWGNSLVGPKTGG